MAPRLVNRRGVLVMSSLLYVCHEVTDSNEGNGCHTASHKRLLQP